MTYDLDHLRTLYPELPAETLAEVAETLRQYVELAMEVVAHSERNALTAVTRGGTVSVGPVELRSFTTIG